MSLQLVWCYDHDRLETIEEHELEKKVTMFKKELTDEERREAEAATLEAMLNKLDEDEDQS